MYAPQEPLGWQATGGYRQPWAGGMAQQSNQPGGMFQGNGRFNRDGKWVVPSNKPSRLQQIKDRMGKGGYMRETLDRRWGKHAKRPAAPWGTQRRDGRWTDRGDKQAKWGSGGAQKIRYQGDYIGNLSEEAQSAYYEKRDSGNLYARGGGRKGSKNYGMEFSWNADDGGWRTTGRKYQGADGGYGPGGKPPWGSGGGKPPWGSGVSHPLTRPPSSRPQPVSPYLGRPASNSQNAGRANTPAHKPVSTAAPPRSYAM